MKINVSIYLFSCLIILSIFSCKQQVSSDLQHANITVTEARNKQGKPRVMFLDVRTPAEIAKGKIAGALEIDYRADGFEEKVKDLDKDIDYVVYCKSGGRSAKAQAIMKNNGFINTYNMTGGYTAWNSSKN